MACLYCNAFHFSEWRCLTGLMNHHMLLIGLLIAVATFFLFDVSVFMGTVQHWFGSAALLADDPQTSR
jgi:hypothetical protein